MKKLLLFTFLLFSTCSFAEQLNIDDLSEGLVTKYDSLLIPDNAVSDCQNVLFDDISIVSKRKGMIKSNSTQLGSSEDRNIYGEYEYIKSNGTRYHISQSSNTLYYRTSGSDFTAFTSTISKTYPCNYAVFMDTLQFCNGVDNLSYWTGSSSGTTTDSYQPRYVIAWSNRLWIAGDGDELSKVRVCEWLNPSNWTIPTSNALATDPVEFDINSQDGQKCVGFFISPNGSLGILKEKSTWEISGNDRDDYILKLVNSDIGCCSDGSIAYKDGDVYWMSKKGFCKYNGNSIEIISHNIDDIVKTLKQIEMRNDYYSKNSQADWQTYKSTDLVDTTTLSGSITPKFSNTLTDYHPYYTSDGFVSAKSSDTYIFTVATSGQLKMVKFDYETQNVTISTIDTGLNLEKYSKWVSTLSYGGSNYYAVTYRKGTSVMYAVCYDVDITTPVWYKTTVDSDAGIGEQSIALIGSGGQVYVAYTNDTNHTLNVYRTTSGGSTKAILASDGINWDGCAISRHSNGHPEAYILSVKTTSSILAELTLFDVSFWSYPNNSITSRAILKTYNGTVVNKRALDIENDASSFKTYAVWQNYDGDIEYFENSTETVLDNSNYLINSITIRNNTGTPYIVWTNVNYGTYISKNASTKTLVIAKTGAYDTSSSNMFYDARTSSYQLFRDNYGNFTTPKLYIPYMEYIDNIYDTNKTDTYYFDNFISEQTNNNYNINHYIRGNSVEAYVSTQSWTLMTSGSIISLTPERYFQYKCIISTDIPQENLGFVNQININYHSSSGSTRLSSMCYDDRIWNAVSKNSPTYLDYQLIYDSNGKWTVFTSTIPCMSLLNYAGIPYMGDNNGYIYQLDQTDADDGKAIDAYFVTKSYPLGSVITYKNINKLFLIADYAGNWDLNFYYYLDRLDTPNESFTIDLDQTTGIINYKVPLLKNTPFTTIKFKVSNSDANEPFDFFGLTTLYQYQPVR